MKQKGVLNSLFGTIIQEEKMKKIAFVPKAWRKIGNKAWRVCFTIQLSENSDKHTHRGELSRLRWAACQGAIRNSCASCPDWWETHSKASVFSQTSDFRNTKCAFKAQTVSLLLFQQFSPLPFHFRLHFKAHYCSHFRVSSCCRRKNGFIYPQLHSVMKILYPLYCAFDCNYCEI